MGVHECGGPEVPGLHPAHAPLIVSCHMQEEIGLLGIAPKEHGPRNGRAGTPKWTL